MSDAKDSQAKEPRGLMFAVGRICEVGQHENCIPVGNPYDERHKRRPVWVCSCDCHTWLGDYMEEGRVGHPFDPCVDCREAGVTDDRNHCRHCGQPRERHTPGKGSR